PGYVVRRQVGPRRDPDGTVLHGVDPIRIADRLPIEATVLPDRRMRTSNRGRLGIVDRSKHVGPLADLIGLDPGGNTSSGETRGGDPVGTEQTDRHAAKHGAAEASSPTPLTPAPYAPQRPGQRCADDVSDPSRLQG